MENDTFLELGIFLTSFKKSSSFSLMKSGLQLRFEFRSTYRILTNTYRNVFLCRSAMRETNSAVDVVSSENKHCRRIFELGEKRAFQIVFVFLRFHFFAFP